MIIGDRCIGFLDVASQSFVCGQAGIRHHSASEQSEAYAVVASAVDEPARAAILIALLDGKSRTAGELAVAANISVQSASDGGLLTMDRSGRHCYYSVAGPDVAHALEQSWFDLFQLALVAQLGTVNAALRCRATMCVPN